MTLRYLILSFLTLSSAISVKSQWTLEQNYVNSYYFELVSVVDSSVVWAAGTDISNSIVILKRTPPGWRTVLASGLGTGQIRALFARDSSSAWLAGYVNYRSKLFYTTDGGNTWQVQIDSDSSYITDLEFSRLNPSYGYAVAAPSYSVRHLDILKTTNGGLTWQIFPVPVDSGYYSGGVWSHPFSVTDSSHVWIGLGCTCMVPKILFTSTGGISWNLVTLQGNELDVPAIEFRNDNLYGLLVKGVPVSYYNYVHRSTNGGLNWTSFSTLYYPYEPAEKLVWANETSMWYYNGGANIAKSSDNGAFWVTMSAPISGDGVKDMDAIKQGSNVYGWAVTQNGRIIRLVEPAFSIGIQEIGSEIPSDFQLFQSCPNPFNSSATIKFQIPKRTFVQIKIYNALGEEIDELVNEELGPGIFETDWNASNFPSGAYLYRIQAGDFTDSKKMILVK